MRALTVRQQQILDFIREFIEAEGFPPTRAEIAQALGFRSVNAAEDHLKALLTPRASLVKVEPKVSLNRQGHGACLAIPLDTIDPRSRAVSQVLKGAHIVEVNHLSALIAVRVDEVRA